MSNENELELRVNLRLHCEKRAWASAREVQALRKRIRREETAKMAQAQQSKEAGK